MISDKIHPYHLERKALLYVRQSSAHQVLHNRESSALQYAMRDRLTALGWSQIEVIDDDLGRSAAGSVQRAGFERMVAEVCLGKVGAVCAREVSRFARNSRDWQQLIEMCRVARSPSSLPNSSRLLSKGAFRAASISSVSATRTPNGAGNSSISASIPEPSAASIAIQRRQRNHRLANRGLVPGTGFLPPETDARKTRFGDTGDLQRPEREIKSARRARKKGGSAGQSGRRGFARLGGGICSQRKLVSKGQLPG